VRAIINGKECTQSGNVGTVRNGSVAEFAITVPHESQTPGCGTDGARVTFTVGGQKATQEATWKAGPQPLNLSVGQATPPPLPSATPRTPQDPTSAAATATSEARFTPLPAPSALPTDEPIFPAATRTIGTGIGPAAKPTPAANTKKDDNDGSALAPIGAVIVVLLLAGAAGGFVLARRRPGDSA
jgi:hypothetical protein